MSIESLKAEVQRLAQIQRGLITALIFGAIVIGYANWRATTPNSYLLRDSTGRLRASYSLIDDEPGLAMYGPDGNVRLAIGTTTDGAEITLSGISEIRLADPNGKPRVQLAVTSDGSATVAMKDSAHKMRVALTVKGDDTQVAVFGPEGQPVWGTRHRPISN